MEIGLEGEWGGVGTELPPALNYGLPLRSPALRAAPGGTASTAALEAPVRFADVPVEVLSASRAQTKSNAVLLT